MAPRKKKSAGPALIRTRSGQIRLRRKPNAPYARGARPLDDRRAQDLRAEIDKAVSEGQKIREQIEAKIERKIREAEAEEKKAAAERKRLGLDVSKQKIQGRLEKLQTDIKKFQAPKDQASKFPGKLGDKAQAGGRKLRDLFRM
jgi:hypothetical protein